MAFLNPLVLIALAAAAIPLLIHLFNFRRARRVDYSSLRFLKELRRTTLQRVRVERWLLLLLRVLTVLCLVAVFARPILVGSAFTGDAKVSAAIVMDNSLSMTLRDQGGTYLEQARTLARTLVQQSDEAFVLLTSPEPVLSGVAALDQIDNAVANARAETALEAIARAATHVTEHGMHSNQEVYFVGDLQESMLADTTSPVIPPVTHVTLVPAGRRGHDNVAVESVKIKSRIIEAGAPVEIEATLSSHQEASALGYVASLYLEGERVAQQSVDLVRGARTSVSFTVRPAQRGWLSGRVKGEDDAFALDDEHYFTLLVPPKRRVLVAHGPGATTEFVTVALAAARDSMEVDVIADAALTQGTLPGYDALLMVAPSRLPSQVVVALERFVSGGGGLMLFPDEDLAATNAILTALGGGAVSDMMAGTPAATVTGLDPEHPLFEGIFDDADRMEEPVVFRAATYVPKAGTEQTLLFLSNGRPFLQELRRGQGQALFMVAGPDPSWTDLPVRGLFVPLMHRAVLYLSSTESVQGDRLVTGQPAQIRLGGASGPFRLRTPDAEEAVPEQRQLIGATLVTISESHGAPGIYDLLQGSSVVRRMAMNTDPRESQLALASFQEAARTLSAATGLPVEVASAGSAVELSERLREDRVGVELWRTFTVLALIFLGLEMLVSARGRPQPV